MKNKYLELKNKNGNLEKKSRNLRAEAINNVWNKHTGKAKDPLEDLLPAYSALHIIRKG